jgi:hypothetical protein
MLDSIRDNNMTTIESVCELVDNSLDAGAQNVWIDFDVDKKTGEMWMIVMDDGSGIAKDNIPKALQLGGTMNPRTFSNKIGRFGMGLSNACASQSKRSILASKIKDDQKVWANEIDFDFLKKNDANLPDTYELKDDFLLSQLRFEESGTIVYWTICDNLDVKTMAILYRNILDAVSKTYRHFINEGRKIHLQSKEIQLTDPLCRLESHRFKDEYGMEKLYGDPIVIPITYKNEKGKDVVSNVVVELVLLDYDKIIDSKDMQKKLDIGMPAQGFYLIRNKREINNRPDWYGARSYKYDHLNYIRGEIRFDSCLDKLFGIGHNKSKAYPKDSILDAIKNKVSTRVSAALTEHLRKRRQKMEADTGGNEMAKKIFESAKSTIKGKIEVQKDKGKTEKKPIQEEELEKELFEKIDKDPTINEEKKNKKKEAIRKILEDKYSRGIIVTNDGATAPIFRVEIVNGKQIIMVNGAHKFYEYVYEPATRNLYAYPLVDLTFYILSEIRENIDDQTFIELFDEIINIFSRKYGSMLGQKEFSEVIAAASEEETS